MNAKYTRDATAITSHPPGRKCSTDRQVGNITKPRTAPGSHITSYLTVSDPDSLKKSFLFKVKENHVNEGNINAAIKERQTITEQSDERGEQQREQTLNWSRDGANRREE